MSEHSISIIYFVPFTFQTSGRGAFPRRISEARSRPRRNSGKGILEQPFEYSLTRPLTKVTSFSTPALTLKDSRATAFHGRVAEPHPRLGRNDRTQREGNSPSSHPEYPSLDNTRRRPNRHYFYNCLVTFPKRSSQVGYSLNFISRHSPPNIHLWAIYCPMLLPGESSSRLFTCKSTNHRPGTGMASCEAPCHCTGD